MMTSRVPTRLTRCGRYLGSGAAFSQRYPGMEPNLPPPPSTVAVANEAADDAQQLLESDVPTRTPVAADAAGLAAAAEPKQVLLADSSKGELLIDRGAVPVRKPPSPKPSDDCPAPSSKRIVPVHPDAPTVLGEQGYATLADVPFPIDVVDVFRRSDAAGEFADQAVKVGAKAVWFQLGVIDEDAIRRTRRAGVRMVMDTCPAIEWSAR